MHYLNPDDNETNIVDDYGLMIFTEFNPTSISLTFFIIQSSEPVIITQNIEK